MDAENLGLNHLATVERLRKTQKIVDVMADKIFSTYGTSSANAISYSTMDRIYDEKVSGIGGINAVKAHLLEHGMSSRLADKLEARYLRRVSEHATVCTVMDLFSCPKAKAKFFATPSERVHLNYSTKPVSAAATPTGRSIDYGRV